MCKQFLEDNPDSAVIYFESESAITKEMIEERGIDSNRMIIVPVVTVQEFRQQAISILDKYLETDESKKTAYDVLFRFTWYVINYKRNRRHSGW